MGKTTLAQLVYNDEKVQEFFKPQAWAHVSQVFDVVGVTKAILQSLTFENCDGKDLTWLQNKLKKELKGKKFLVVLDNIWNKNYQDWTLLCVPFEEGVSGSAIVITTRNNEVALKTRTTNILDAFPLNGLSNDSCLSILAHHALGTTDFIAHLNLKDIGQELARRRKSSPLVAKVLRGVLHNKVHLHEWEEVLNSNLWDIAEVENEIAQPLMLSCHDLPSNLKRYFAYCSIIPKDYEFEEKQLVQLWMTEGLIKPRDGRKKIEDLGREDFRNLLSRSFFQLSFKDESRFVMHDLINDLAQHVAGDTCFKMEDIVGGHNRRKPSRKAQHSSYLGGHCDGIKKFATLILESCYALKKLPSTFGNLLNLRHLNIRGAYALEGMPPQIRPLLHIRDTLCISKLENVINNEDARDARLFEKKNLSGVSFEWSQNIDESQDRAHELEVLSMLKPHKGLKELTINNYGCTEFPKWLRVPSFSNMVLLKIESCAKCTSLLAVGKLPSLNDLLIKGMGSLKNIGCEFYGEYYSQPFRSLETLHFEDMQKWENWIPCEEFPKLCKLSIKRCPKLMVSLEEKEVEEQLQLSLPSKLRKITIFNCKSLESLPKAMMNNNIHLEEVYISFCNSLTHFAIGQLPPTLKRLTIEGCNNMQILGDGDDINKCGSSKSLL
ncbi:putative disease resistance RPP13-like protein 1 [Corylus avellana]|uniref:putative disease resistance RPP13-like protein 1 n=1 Tax=Corylus avellana TaxID=13451 RepID=UPI00286B4652|nr:putative disease resistance RPP13-like protein 1 [Corylus avellana]